MENYCETLRELIQRSDIDKVADLMFEFKSEDENKEEYKRKVKNFSENFLKRKNHPDAKRTAVVVQLLLKEENSMWIENDYLEVSIENPNFVTDPDLNLRPWGGKTSEPTCPEGFYNCNWVGYNRVFGVSGLDLELCLDAPVKLKDEKTKNYIESDEQLLAGIFFEFTLYGFTETEARSFWEEMERRTENLKVGEGYTTDEVRDILNGG